MEKREMNFSFDFKDYPDFKKDIRRAPSRGYDLSQSETKLAVENALRYIPKKYHEILAKEFLKELKEHGRIYGYRFRPEGKIYGKSIDSYKGECIEGRAIQVMIDNNLDFDVALYPYELVTYGETGQVFQNWMQYNLIKKYLEVLKSNETLVIQSGHPLGLFPSFESSPRVIITNGLMVGMADNNAGLNRAQKLGVSNYGQMTAGGLMYIGPQGIVHGTYNTLINAGRIKYNIKEKDDLKGYLFVTSGLGGMSGAQPKAADIANAVSIVAEVDLSRIKTRKDQGWVKKIAESEDEAFTLAQKYLEKKQGMSIAYHGNIVDLLQYAVDNNIKIDLLSDQTSCHAVYDGGYCPQSVSFDERTRLLEEDRDFFKSLVDKTLIKHYNLVKKLTERGTYFFDYGNSFMKAIYDAGETSICKNGENENDGFVFPSYVEDIMGPELFDYGYGPFRWVCLSGKESDLDETDKCAMNLIKKDRRAQDMDNYNWIKGAKENNLVVGTKARILYQDAEGRLKIALAFNKLVRDKKVGPIMLGRDHHDTGGTDSPFRETANIKDGSNMTADMAVQSFAGNAARGMSMIALHNGGGVGAGKSINGGFGLVLDGSKKVDEIIKKAFPWDVMGGVARRAWARNENSVSTAETYNKKGNGYITIPEIVDQSILDNLFGGKDE